MSKVSEYIHEHVNFLNMLLPILKVVVDAAPVPPQVKTDFDAVYARAPGVILAGAAAVQAVTGAEQPAAEELAGAFVGGLPVETAPTPAPVPVAPAPVIFQPAPAPASQQIGAAVTPTQPLVPSLVAPPSPPTLVDMPAPTPAPPPATVTIEPAEIPTPADLGPTVDQSELIKMARAMGLQIVGPNGQPIS